MAAKSSKKVLISGLLLLAVVVALFTFYRGPRPYDYPSPFWSGDRSPDTVKKMTVPAAVLDQARQTIAQFAKAEGLQFLERDSHPSAPWYDWHLWNKDYEIRLNNHVYTDQLSLALFAKNTGDARGQGTETIARLMHALSALPGVTVRAN